MMLHLATLFDRNYLGRGLALLESLQKCSSQSFKLYILALDEAVVSYFFDNKQEAVEIIPLSALEKFYPELQVARSNRSKVEYYFTLSPFLPSYILKVYNIDRITTLDSDLYFFDDPALIFDAYPEASILITPHNFAPELEKSVIYGRYNVSLQSFKNNEEGLRCLEKWRTQCAAWCYDKLDLENNRYADQKYLDNWLNEFEGVAEINIPGAGLAPWNISKHNFTTENGKILVNGKPVIYFHFHHLRVFNSFFAINALAEYLVKKTNSPIRKIYHQYLRRLKTISKNLVAADNNVIRYNLHDSKNFIRKLIDTNGYWVFSNWFIFYINPSKYIVRFKNLFK